MAEKNNVVNTIESMFEGMDSFISSKTVVGEPIKVDDAIILPLVDVSCGMACGTFGENSKNNSSAGLSTKITPSSVLIIQNGLTKLVNIKNQDAFTKVLDMLPDLLNKFTADKTISKEKVDIAKEQLKTKETIDIRKDKLKTKETIDEVTNE